MNLSFSTTCKQEAKQRFEHEKFKWLSAAAKEYVLANINDGLRVQCTMMYTSPQVEFHGERAQEHYQNIKELL